MAIAAVMRRWCAAALLLGGLAGCQEHGPVVPAASIKLLMTTVTEPASKQVFEAAAEPPQDEAGWRAARTNAEAVAASARKLVKAVRGGNRNEWVELANVLASTSDQAAAAAAARDANALAAAGDALYASCERCHAAFRPQRGR